MAAIYPDLAGKVVPVTGGASGIGEAVVRGFARQKSTVVFFDIADKAGMSLARELSGQGLAAHFAHVDVTDIPALRTRLRPLQYPRERDRPGWIMTERQLEKWLTPESEAELMRRQCLKRKLMPDDIARFTVFLASDEASACTAQHYVVDGGWV